MKTVISFLKKEAMLVVSVAAALVSLVITPPSADLVKAIDWKTLATLFMLLSVLDGFKHENLFLPLLRLTEKFSTLLGLSFFLVFGVFFSSMFVTNDVSLIIFVPLTILLFREKGKEGYILPILAMENIAAVRGSLLTPFGSPQNLFLFGQSGMDALCDETWVVFVPEKVQLRRVMARDGLTAPQAQARIDSQMPLAEKLRRADRAIDNAGSMEQTRAALRALWEGL